MNIPILRRKKRLFKHGRGFDDIETRLTYYNGSIQISYIFKIAFVQETKNKKDNFLKNKYFFSTEFPIFTFLDLSFTEQINIKRIFYC